MDMSNNEGRKQQRLTTRQITAMGLTLALLILLSFIPSINIGNLVQIGFGFVGTAFAGALFGPWYGAVLAIANDLITYFMNGTGFFFPGFTLTAGLAAWIYGKVLWRRPKTWHRILIAVTLTTLICNLGLNSLWVRIMYDRAWMAFLPMRFYKNLISLPLNTIVLSIIFNLEPIKRIIKQFEL